VIVGKKERESARSSMRSRLSASRFHCARRRVAQRRRGGGDPALLRSCVALNRHRRRRGAAGLCVGSVLNVCILRLPRGIVTAATALDLSELQTAHRVARQHPRLLLALAPRNAAWCHKPISRQFRSSRHWSGCCSACRCWRMHDVARRRGRPVGTLCSASRSRTRATTSSDEFTWGRTRDRLLLVWAARRRLPAGTAGAAWGSSCSGSSERRGRGCQRRSDGRGDVKMMAILSDARRAAHRIRRRKRSARSFLSRWLDATEEATGAVGDSSLSGQSWRLCSVMRSLPGTEHFSKRLIDGEPLRRILDSGECWSASASHHGAGAPR